MESFCLLLFFMEDKAQYLSAKGISKSGCAVTHEKG